jgi:hypothetical protein
MISLEIYDYDQSQHDPTITCSAAENKTMAIMMFNHQKLRNYVTLHIRTVEILTTQQQKVCRNNKGKGIRKLKEMEQNKTWLKKLRYNDKEN